MGTIIHDTEKSTLFSAYFSQTPVSQWVCTIAHIPRVTQLHVLCYFFNNVRYWIPTSVMDLFSGKTRQVIAAPDPVLSTQRSISTDRIWITTDEKKKINTA